ncbi:MAG TPA: inorganic diphosphatase, partial [Gemmatimonadota bacterium]|nr:inorganic diphosphatase [Gemmatimonadota bacterium]
VVDRFVVSPVAYPANYGFVTGTLEGDGDPLDVLIWTREPVVPGAVVRARAIGILRMTDAGERDTKILAVPATDVDPRYADVGGIDDLGRWERERVVSFFELYKDLPAAGRVELGGIGDAAEALAALSEAHDRCRQGG